MHRSAGLRVLAVLFCWLGSSASGTAASTPLAAVTPAFGHAAIVQREGEPTLVLDGKPVFFWGAAFFYERLPATQWRSSMLELQRLGVTTLDLYVPWNWHELADGQFDFDGHTNPRRNLREVLRLGRELGFTFIVRPGPVIRNEWRNGGYPAWLLTRPEYGMPLHDVLEGRYPATATLQNAHSDDAAAEWMRNATHLRYAARWLHRALTEFRPVADRVLAVQLDDDQGAYIDNQTYPAPHLQRYLHLLESQVREVVGPVTPTFINTYEMRVPASSPAWTMGNWYQSDAYAIGEHDRLSLDLATAMLRTNRRGPLAISEFQAGWLAQPEDPQPRPADPTNTTLALYELLGWGAHGVVDFPMQDTLAPFGWEAPFSNALYAWDAALRYPDGTVTARENTPPFIGWTQQGPRYWATRRFGETVHALGPLLARAHRVADVAIAYPGSSYPGSPTAGMTSLEHFRDTVRDCVRGGTTCEVVDLASAGLNSLRHYRTVVIDDARTHQLHAELLRELARNGTRVVARVPVEGLPGTVLRGPDATLLVAVNWSSSNQQHRARRLGRGSLAIDLPSFWIGPRQGAIIALDVPLSRVDARYRPALRLRSSCAIYADDDDGVVLHGGAGPCELRLRDGTRNTAASVAIGQGARIHFDGTITRERTVRFGDADMFLGGDDTISTLSPREHVVLEGTHQTAMVGSETYRADPFADGATDVVLQNGLARAIVVPDGGARIPIFELFAAGSRTNFRRPLPDNAFDATGALRDDVLVQPPPSTTDRIARYTHSYPAGTFNRAYTVTDATGGSVRLSTYVPDVVPHGARFERIVTLMPDTARLVVDERVTFGVGFAYERQRGVVLSALVTAPDTHGIAHRQLFAAGASVTSAGQLDAPNGIALIGDNVAGGGIVLAVSWRPRDVESASWTPQRSNGTLRLVLAPGWRRVTYALTRVKTAAEADAFVEAERAWVAANPARISEDGEVAKRYTQSPQKRPSVSSCGFESHLPQ